MPSLTSSSGIRRETIDPRSRRPLSASCTYRGMSRSTWAPPTFDPASRLPENTARSAGRVMTSSFDGMPTTVTVPAARAMSNACTISSGRPTASNV